MALTDTIDSATKKSLILTYHRVTNDAAAKSFYDVPLTHFREQIIQVAAHKSDLKVVLAFDDGTQDHMRAAEILTEHSLSGVFFLVWNRLGTPGHLTGSDARRLVECGHVVASHSLTHRRLPLLSVAELRNELVHSRQALEQATGRPVQWFAPPGGAYDARTLSAARSAGYAFVRTMDWGYAPALNEAGVDALLPTVPVLRDMSPSRFETILNKRALFTGFMLKQTARRLLPETTYMSLREWAMRASITAQGRV